MVTFMPFASFMYFTCIGTMEGRKWEEIYHRWRTVNLPQFHLLEPKNADIPVPAELPYLDPKPIHVLCARTDHQYGNIAAICAAAVYQHSWSILDPSKPQ